MNEWTPDIDESILLLGAFVNNLVEGWDTVTQLVNDKYGTSFDSDAIKKRYARLTEG